MTTLSLQNRRVRISLYMLIALSFSYFFRVAPPAWFQAWDVPALWEPFKRLAGASGIFAGAFLMERLGQVPQRVTLGGTSWRNGLLMLALPVLLFTVMGVPHDSLNVHLFGLIVGLQAVLWVLLEEYGWRKYLHNELGDIKPLHRYLIIGGLWYTWHLWFLQHSLVEDPANFLLNMVVGFTIIMSASWGLGVVVEQTKSVLTSACFHMLGSFIQFNPIITENVDQGMRWVLFAVCLVVWVVALVRWKPTRMSATTIG